MHVAHVAGALVAGLAVGWLVGLSAATIAQSLLTAILGAVLGAAGVVATLRARAARAGQHNAGSIIPAGVDPLLASVAIVGIAVGASVGEYAKANQWLGPDPSAIASRWRRTGMKETEIVSRVFDKLYPRSGAARPSGAASGQSPNQPMQPAPNAP